MSDDKLTPGPGVPPYITEIIPPMYDLDQNGELDMLEYSRYLQHMEMAQEANEKEKDENSDDDIKPFQYQSVLDNISDFSFVMILVAIVLIFCVVMGIFVLGAID